MNHSLHLCRVSACFCLIRCKLFFLLLPLILSTAFSQGNPAPNPHPVLLTMHLTNAPLERAFALIKRQTPYRVIYDNSILKAARPVTISVEKESLSRVLDLIFQDQTFDYRIVNETIIITPGKARSGDSSPETEMPAFTVKDTAITGTVFADSTLIPLAGATIAITGGNVYAVTDNNGNFRITIPANSKAIAVSYIGYQTQHISLQMLRSRRVIITLKRSAQEMQGITIINTGYQALPRERATGSFTQIDNAKFNEQVGTNILDRLPSIANSLSVIPGRILSNTISIRGLSTINGPKNPLIVIDNFPYEGDINNINPNDVEGITLLKDAAAASIWGTKAGNGVIVITTKKGQFNQRTKIEFNSNVTVNQKPDLFVLKNISSSDFINVEKYLFYQGYYDGYLQYAPYQYQSPVVNILAEQRAGILTSDEANAQIDALKNKDVRNDYEKYIYRNAINQQYALSMRGGSDNLAWILSAGYDKDLNELSAEYNRLNIRSENVYRVNRKIQITAGFYYTHSKARTGKQGYFDISTTNGHIPPYTQLADANGNPLSVYKDYRKDYIDTAGNGKLLDWNYYPLNDYKFINNAVSIDDLLANFNFQYKIVNNLNLEIRYQYDRQQTGSSVINSQQSYYTRNLINTFTEINTIDQQIIYKIPLGSILDQSNNTQTSQNVRGQFNYSKTWPKSNISAIFGTEIHEIKDEGGAHRNYGYDNNILTYTNVDFTNPYPTYPDGGNQFIPNTENFTNTINRFVSFYANAAYTYIGKYTVSASGRRDASNLFGVNTNNKWTPLWSAGLAWNLSAEKFYRIPAVPYSKFRITYGFSGNVDPGKSAVSTIQYADQSPYTLSPMATIDNIFNPDLKWEKIGMLNIGLDFKVKRDIISGSIEYYNKKSVNLYGLIPIDRTTGLATSTLLKNAADIKGHGIDLELNSINIHKAVTWITDFNFNYYNDKVVRYYNASVSGDNFVGGIGGALPGYPIYSLFTYKWAGLDPETGDPQGYLNKKISKDYTSLIVDSSQYLSYQGSALPTIFGSLGNTIEWRGFSLTARITYKFGYSFLRQSINYDALYRNSNGTSDFAERWQKPGDEKVTNVPSMIYPNNSNRDFFYNNSDALSEKGDHIRLQYINLSYDVLKGNRSNAAFGNFKVFIVVNNLGIIWRANKRGIDPDYYSNSQLPPLKSFSIGINARLN